jgi:alpha-galactosidase
MNQTLNAYRSNSDTVTDDLLSHASWGRAQPVQLKHYWSGESAPQERRAEVRAVWTSDSLIVRFDCQQHEPLIVNSKPQTAEKSIGLWERDACEIFIAPNADEPERYFEFEAAPSGEWLDLAIHQMPDKRETDWEYSSGMTVAAKVEDNGVTICMRIPFEALGRIPQTGERWRVNLFRCIGSGDSRGYLAWQPTRTEVPNFHVPDAFGWLCFVG